MKSTQIRRHIESPNRRMAGAVPGLGRVARVRDSGKKEAARHSHDGEWVIGTGSGRRVIRNRSLLLLSIGLAAGTFLVIAAFTVLWVRSHKNVPAIIIESDFLKNERITSRFASPTEGEALSLVRKALANRDPGVVETLIRCGTVTPEKVVEFMAGLEASDGGVESMSWLGSVDVEGMLMDGVLVLFEGKSTPVERIAFLIPDEMGLWRMDFEGFARTSTPPWGELLEKRADRSQVRVLIARDSYFNGPFIDESRWDCFALAATEAQEWLPEDGGFLRGYCRKDSPQARAMERIFGQGAKVRRATVEILRTEGAGERQFEITRVLAEDWVLPAKPFDGKFQ